MFGSHPDVYASYEKSELKQSFTLTGFVPFMSLLILIGGSIVITLVYVSWRKYRGIKQNKQIKKRNSNY